MHYLSLATNSNASFVAPIACVLQPLVNFFTLLDFKLRYLDMRQRINYYII